MANNSLDCYVLPASPLPLLLPRECVAEIVEKPEIMELDNAPANWMRGHVTWDKQRIPVLSYSALHDADIEEAEKGTAVLVVLNPIPDAVRKAFVGILCFGRVEEVLVDDTIAQCDIPKNADRRYVETAVSIGERKFLIPKLASVGVAFSYL